MKGIQAQTDMIGQAYKSYESTQAEAYKTLEDPKATPQDKAKAQASVKSSEQILTFATDQLASYLRKLSELIEKLGQI